MQEIIECCLTSEREKNYMKKIDLLQNVKEQRICNHKKF